jgi:hypothetical protein
VFDSIRSLFRDAGAGRQPLAVNDLVAEVMHSLDDELKGKRCFGPILLGTR